MRFSLAFTVLALALVAVPGAFAERSYSDPTGDSGLAPDISAVRVSHDSGGLITIAITTNQPTLPADATIWGYIDSDRNAATGLSFYGLGADHVFLADAEGGVLFHINGSSLTVDFDSSFSSSHADGIFTARVHRDDIGSPERFGFVVEAELNDANGDSVGSDVAPDGPPVFEYSLTPLQLTLGPAVGSPAKPVSGKRLVVSTQVSRSDGQTFSAGTVTCVARVGKVALKPVSSVASGTARCAMKVPKAMSGKLVRGSIAVSAEDSTTVTRPFSFRVR